MPVEANAVAETLGNDLVVFWIAQRERSHGSVYILVLEASVTGRADGNIDASIFVT